MPEVAAWGDLIGKPFAYGARGPDAFDCYGLVVEMNRRAGIIVPDYISPRNDFEIAELIDGHKVLWKRTDLKPGATVVLRLGRHICHVGYMVSRTRMIHAWEKSGGVCVEDMHEWKYRINGFFEFAK